MKKILLVDDHEVVRDGVKRILDKQPGPTSFGEASTGAEALELVEEHDWDMVVLDISLRDQDGLEVLKKLKQIRPHLPVLILSMHSEHMYARRALQSGAAGYVTKNSSRAELVQAVTNVLNGETYISPAIGEKLVVDFNGKSDRL